MTASGTPWRYFSKSVVRLDQPEVTAENPVRASRKTSVRIAVRYPRNLTKTISQKGPKGGAAHSGEASELRLGFCKVRRSDLTKFRP